MMPPAVLDSRQILLMMGYISMFARYMPETLIQDRRGTGIEVVLVAVSMLDFQLLADFVVCSWEVTKEDNLFPLSPVRRSLR